MLEVKRAGALASLDEPECVPASLWAGKEIGINLSQFIGNFRCSGQLMEGGREKGKEGGREEEQEEGEREEGRDRGKGLLQQLPGVRLPTPLQMLAEHTVWRQGLGTLTGFILQC